MGKLSTHVLDTMHGKPAQGVRIELFRIQDNGRSALADVATNSDGRCDQPLLQGEALQKGVYELVFHIGDYFAGKGVSVPAPRFVDQVGQRNGVANPGENCCVSWVNSVGKWST